MTKITALPPGMAVGFRFHPTDQELITNYLIPKILGTDSDVDNVIAEVDFYKFEPWDLPSQSKIESKDQIWLFFCKPEYKRPISKQSKRATKEGSWTITGKERLIKNQETKKCIGKKRTLVFFRGKGSKRGERTNWVFHEYFIDDNHFPNQNSYVLCRLKKKVNNKANTLDCGEGNPSRNINMSEVEDSLTLGATSTSWAHVHQEVIQELSSQPLYSPGHNLLEEQYGLPPSVGILGETNTGEAEVQHVVLDGGRPDMLIQELQGFTELQADSIQFQGGGVSSTEISESGRVMREGGRPDMFFQELQAASVQFQGGGVSSTEISESGYAMLELGTPEMLELGTAEMGSAGQAYNPRRHRRREILLCNGVSSTEMSGNEVGEEAETNISVSASDLCLVAVVIISMILTAVFVLMVFYTCKLALSQLGRKRTLFVALCSVLFFWVYNYRNMPGVSGDNAVELNPTAGMLQW